MREIKKKIFCFLTFGHKYKAIDVPRSSGLFFLVRYGAKCVKCRAEVMKPNAPETYGGF
jgi:hypothetical protein